MDEFKRYDENGNEINGNENNTNNVDGNDYGDVVETTIIKSHADESNDNSLSMEKHNQAYSDQCFQERIKNEEKKARKKIFTWKKVIACVLVAVLMGGAFQLGMEVTKPFFEKFVGSTISQNDDSNKFAFEDKNNTTALTEDNLKEVSSDYTSIINDNYESPVVAIAENMKPSIVTITSVVTAKDWFNNQYEQEGTGSGIIFGENEDVIYIVTNQHVIDGARNVVVTFFNSENINAKVVGYEREYDLAVLSVAKKDMKKELLDSIKIAKLGDSDKIKVGELAVAIGNPLGKQYSNTVTVGYISAINRTLESTDKSLPLIQTDAAINPGNSGGALVNAQSEVIGINSYKLASTDIEGMGFAIPVNEAKPIIEDIVNKKDRPALGIRGIDVTEEMGDFYGLPIGILVKEVTEGSGAEKAGLRSQDIIFEFGGAKIFNFEDLQKEIEKYEVGDTVSVKVARKTNNGFEKVELNVKLTDRQSIM
ncbi:S1C family serine protease [Vallitalea guaymasensis]|uniref:Trypsin-like peptidase domain-containing protein n=1 Tax=Vallitalea guaymasensis TaxID=1185412 RepID=A0A8J8MBG6_9FIRM|nr:trypsin-like peptidase domain-containing protein [Vallitalea guaymasensis]QUH29728.1 trypsin-like peptidase domain-containing protein [Vallitalea guaymasensis]